MYKIRELAKILDVETVEIHKKLISLKKELTGHVKKNNGIISVDAEGLNIISLSLTGKGTERIEFSFVNQEGESSNFTGGKEEDSACVVTDESDDAEINLQEPAPTDRDLAFPLEELEKEEAFALPDTEEEKRIEPEPEPELVLEFPISDLKSLDTEDIKKDYFSKKVELNSVNQQIMNELEKTKNYTKELNDLYDKIAMMLK